MKVLIIVCCYNEYDFIESTLKSIKKAVMNELGGNTFELACVDNSSTDGTSELLRRLQSEGVDFNLIEIFHSPLACSRNSYQFFDDSEFDYIAYLDADGGVHEEWAVILSQTIAANPMVDVISGPVYELRQRNWIWECFFDHRLYKGGYLLGANMIFRRQLLDSVEGFPCLFESRGDETGLLYQLKRRSIEYTSIFKNNLIAYNRFHTDYYRFLIDCFGDGKRGSMLQTGTAKIKTLLRFLYVLSLLLAVANHANFGFIPIAILFVLPLCFKATPIFYFIRKGAAGHLRYFLYPFAYLLMLHFLNIGYLAGLLMKRELPVECEAFPKRKA